MFCVIGSDSGLKGEYMKLRVCTSCIGSRGEVAGLLVFARCCMYNWCFMSLLDSRVRCKRIHTRNGTLDVKVWTRGEDMNLTVREMSLDCSKTFSGGFRVQRDNSPVGLQHKLITPVYHRQGLETWM
jgi:hypothetical protein